MKPVSSPRPACSNVFTCPPGRSSRSNSSTSCARESRYAAPRPATPDPITAILTEPLFEQVRRTVVETLPYTGRRMELADSRPVRVGTVRHRTSRISQLVTLVAVLVPPLAVFSAMGVLWGVAFHWVDVAVLAVSYTVCAFGTTIGFHRYFSHRSFEARTPVKAVLAILGCMTVQGPLTQWVTDHRKHHAFSDREGDPHSPHADHPDTAWGSFVGFVHAHVGWMFSNMGMEQGREYGKDLYDDLLIRVIDRVYLLWVALSLGIPFAVGYWLGGTAAGL